MASVVGMNDGLVSSAVSVEALAQLWNRHQTCGGGRQWCLLAASFQQRMGDVCDLVVYDAKMIYGCYVLK